ncbi:hypothetical protein TNCV_1781181 [Trichonephila clavipes]|nr:hypothetical protein TNCV_1781181 [Trichonephila clavipes]
MVRKKHIPIPEQRRARKTPTPRRNCNDSTASEEPPEVTEMDIPLPASPQASRPGTPEKDGPAQLNCKKLRQLASYIRMLSISIESAETSLQLAIDQGIDSTNPMVQKETSFMELYNSKLQKAVSEYTSLPPCGIPNCSQHDIKNTPLKPNARGPSTPIQIKRKEDTEGFTTPI